MIECTAINTQILKQTFTIPQYLDSIAIEGSILMRLGRIVRSAAFKPVMGRRSRRLSRMFETKREFL